MPPPLAPPSHPLPPAIGREEELAALRRLFEEGARFVTLLGPGGIGKTHLARRAPEAIGLAARVVELAGLRSAEELARSFAQALALELPAERPATEALEAVGRALAAEGARLLVLDEAEGAALVLSATLPRLLAAAPALRLLCTSRERLRAPGETVLELGPLPTATQQGPSDAAKLFLLRARAADARFTLDAVNGPAVEALVLALDGLPLAIELAAARIAVLTPKQLLTRLDRSLDLLRTTDPSVPQHHRTLDAVFQTSWEALTEPEKQALAFAAIFEGGFELEAAEAVLGEGALELLQRLREKSLVTTVPGASEARRYRLYASVRAFAARRLELRGERREAESRHARHYLRVGASWAEAAQRRDGHVAIGRLGEERQNLLAIVWRALADGGGAGATGALQGALALEPAVEALGPWPGFAELLGAAVEAADREAAQVPSSLRVRGHAARAAALRLRRELPRAQAEAEAALAAAGDDEALQARALVQLGSVQSLRDPVEAARCYEEALARHRRLGDRRGEAVVRASRAYLLHGRGAFVEMEREAEAAIALLELHEDRRWELGALALLATSCLEQGRLAEAKNHAGRAASIALGRGDRQLRALAELVLAAVETEEGAFAPARERLERLARDAARADEPLFEAIYTCGLARLAHEAGELPQARARYVRADALAPAASPFLRCQLSLFTALLAFDLGEDAAARARLEAARAAAVGLASASISATLRLCDGRAALAESVAAAATGELERARGARARAADALSGPAPGDEARAAARLLTRALRATPALREPLRLDAGLAWFQPPGGARVAFKKQIALRGILGALAELHGTDATLSLDALREAGWPGERMKPEAAANRVHVALSNLRKLGLGELLQSTPDGWRLDPAVPLLRCREPTGTSD